MMGGPDAQRRRSGGTTSADVGVPMAPVLLHQGRHVCGFHKAARLVAQNAIPMPPCLGTKTSVATA